MSTECTTVLPTFPLLSGKTKQTIFKTAKHLSDDSDNVGFDPNFFPHTLIAPLRKRKFREQIGAKLSTLNEMSLYTGRKAANKNSHASQDIIGVSIFAHFFLPKLITKSLQKGATDVWKARNNCQRVLMLRVKLKGYSLQQHISVWSHLLIRNKCSP